MKIICLGILCLTFLGFNSFCQNGVITCTQNQNSDNSYSIIAENRSYADYTLKLQFTTLLGYNSSVPLSANYALISVEYGRREILQLTWDKYGLTHNFNYKYKYYIGQALRKKPDSLYKYLLPTTAGNAVRISKANLLSETIHHKGELYWGNTFEYKLGDTICATRAGIIYDGIDSVTIGEKAWEIYKENRNKIGIQHKDGTLTSYEILSPIHLLVQPGDYVYPGQPMAVFYKESDKYSLILSTFYLDEIKMNEDINAVSSFYYYVCLPTLFYSATTGQAVKLENGKSYVAAHPVDIITNELTRKMKKKLGYLN